jgi:hypothetical protein
MDTKIVMGKLRAHRWDSSDRSSAGSDVVTIGRLGAPEPTIWLDYEQFERIFKGVPLEMNGYITISWEVKVPKFP